MIAFPLLILILVLAVMAPRKPLRKSKHAAWAANHRRRGGVVLESTVRRKAQRVANRAALAAWKAERKARYANESLATSSRSGDVSSTGAALGCSDLERLSEATSTGRLHYG
jgi:hypothetical protein